MNRTTTAAHPSTIGHQVPGEKADAFFARFEAMPEEELPTAA